MVIVDFENEIIIKRLPTRWATLECFTFKEGLRWLQASGVKEVKVGTIVPITDRFGRTIGHKPA